MPSLFRYERKWYECANQTTAYIFEYTPGANSTASYLPTFTYQGFRYVSLTATELRPDGSEAPLSPALAAAFPFGARLLAHRAHTDVLPLSRVRIGPGEARDAPQSGAADAAAANLLTAIFNATLASHTSNLLSIPTDCPQRERRGWMADAGVSASSLNTFYDSLALHINFLRLIAVSQRKGCTDQPQTSIAGPCKRGEAPAPGDAAWFNGSVPDAVPFSTSPYGVNPGTPDWQAAHVMVARSVLLHGGAEALPPLRELFTSRLCGGSARLRNPPV